MADDDQAAAPEPERVEPYYPSAADFFERWLAPTWEYRASAIWCPKWWVHPEAVNRITALWLVWEHLRTDPATGMSVFWRDHADYHLGILSSPDGPLAACGRSRAHRTGEDAASSVLLAAEPAPTEVRALWTPAPPDTATPQARQPVPGDRWWSSK